MENLLFLGVPILKHIRVHPSLCVCTFLMVHTLCVPVADSTGAKVSLSLCYYCKTHIFGGYVILAIFAVKEKSAKMYDFQYTYYICAVFSKLR